jgi:hypothetical protein
VLGIQIALFGLLLLAVAFLPTDRSAHQRS